MNDGVARAPGTGTTCLLLVGDRVVLRATTPPEVEYALFEIAEIELRAGEPGRAREHGYLTTAGEARARLAALGLSSAMARHVADTLHPVLSSAYARGRAVQRIARHLGPAELFQSENYDGQARVYRGVFLDLVALARDTGLEHAGATLHGLYLATILEEEADRATVFLSTEASTKGTKTGARTYRRPSFAEPSDLLAALGTLALAKPTPDVQDALPRADVIAFLRTRADSATDEESRTLYETLEERVSLRDMPERGPLAAPDLWTIETSIDCGNLDGILDAIDAAERAHGKTPGTTYLRARAALVLRLEAPRTIAERVSALALSMTSFQELALLAAESWLDAGDPRRAMPYARDLVDSSGADEGLLLRAQRLLARAVGAAPGRNRPSVADLGSVARPTAELRPPTSALAPDAPRTEAPRRAAFGSLPPPARSEAASSPPRPFDADASFAPLELESNAAPSSGGAALEPLAVLELEEVDDPPTSPRPWGSRGHLSPPPSLARADAPPPIPGPLEPPSLPNGRPRSHRAPTPRDLEDEETPPAFPKIASSWESPPAERPRADDVSPLDRDEAALAAALRSKRPTNSERHSRTGPASASDSEPLDRAASFTLDLPSPETAPLRASTTEAPRSSRRPRLGGVTVETRPPASLDPRAEPNTPIGPRPTIDRSRIGDPIGRDLRGSPARPSLAPGPAPSPKAARTAQRGPLLPPSETAGAREGGSPASVRPTHTRDKTTLVERSSTSSAPPVSAILHGSSLPPFQHENPAPLLPRAPLMPKVGGARDELAEHLALPSGLAAEQRHATGLPTSVLEGRISFTLLSRELGADYRTKRGVELHADISGIEAMQTALPEIFAETTLTVTEQAYELRRHGAFLSEILARRLDAEWFDISPNELGYWAMIVLPDTRVWPFGRIARFLAMGNKERDLVSYYLELQSRARGR